MSLEFFDRAGDLIEPPWAVDPDPQPKVKKPRKKKAKRAHPLVVSQDAYDDWNKGVGIDDQDEGEEIIAIMSAMKKEFDDNPNMLLDLAAEMNNQT